MSENKTKATKQSVQEFIASIEPAEKRADAQALVDLFSELTGEPAVMWGSSMVGYGQRHYKYDSGREGDIFLAGFSPRKAALTLYLPGAMYNFHRFSDVLQKLGPHKLGKGCLYIKQLKDVDMAVLRQFIAATLAHPEL